MAPQAIRAGPVGPVLRGVLVCLLWTGAGRSDTLTLRGGRTLEGIVLEESADSVILDIGMGRMSFARDQVVEIVRSSQKENQVTRETWARRYISVSDLPEPLRPLYRQWAHLQSIRKRAHEGASSLDAQTRELARLSRGIASTRDSYAAVSQELADTPLDRDVNAYNRLVQQNNELVALLNRKQAARAAGEERLNRIRQDISRYAGELTQFERRFDEARGGVPDEGEGAVAHVWLARIDDRLRAFEQDFTRMVVPVSDTTGSTLLEVTVNDRETARFILDTGASIVTLTEPMARRLQLRYDPARPIRLRLADGKTSEGYPVVLDSVAVGDARAEQVSAVVVPSAPGPGVEGLLGMTFLNRFEMSFDAAASRLELRRLRKP